MTRVNQSWAKPHRLSLRAYCFAAAEISPVAAGKIAGVNLRTSLVGRERFGAELVGDCSGRGPGP